MSTDALMTVQITRKTDEAEGICGLELRPLPGQHLPAFSAGSHIELHLPGGLCRTYSMCNDPAESDRYELGVLLEPASRGGSRAVHEHLSSGDTLHISPPRNLFALAEGPGHSLLMAGGIGITPLMSMAQHLHRHGRPFTLHHAARSRARLPYAQRLKAGAFGAQVHQHLDDDPASALDITATLAAAPAGSHLYVCGPQGYMDAVLAAARAQGWPEAQLHWEFFSAAPTARADDGRFEIELASDGRVLAVPADRSVIQVLSDAGVIVPTSCEQGVCGTCLTRVLAGQPDHRDLYLTPEEQAANDQFTPCCSRSLSARLVLDL